MPHSLVLVRTVIWFLIVKFFSYEKKILGFVKGVGFVYSKNGKRRKSNEGSN